MFTHFVNLNVHKGKLAYLSHLASLSGMQERAVPKKIGGGLPEDLFHGANACFGAPSCVHGPKTCQRKTPRRRPGKGCDGAGSQLERIIFEASGTTNKFKGVR